MVYEKNKALLELFKGYYSKDINKDKLDVLVEDGILFLGNISEQLKEMAKEVYSLRCEEWNTTFHKSFAKVRDADIGKLVTEQVSHYITTYGFEELGIYDKDMVYIPAEALEVPELKDDIALTIIRPLSEDNIKEKLNTLVKSGIALSKETLDNIWELRDYISKDEFDNIKNTELRTKLYHEYDIVPRNNIAFLRYLIYETTGKTLLIKDDNLIDAIKNIKDVKKPLFMIKSYIDANGIDKLSSIFLRYKPLFLAFKRSEKISSNKAMNKIINRISKLSSKYHTPIKQRAIDNMFNNDVEPKFIEELVKELEEATTFRLIRILNAIKYRQLAINELDGDKKHDPSPVPYSYKIRNGKVYTKSSNYHNLFKTNFYLLYDIVENVLMKRLSPRIKDKTFYIPEDINYVVPTSEKQFLNEIPMGTYIDIPAGKGNLVMSIHWKNFEEANSAYSDSRVDLDFHLQGENLHFGWNNSFRSEDRDILYSGDVTDAILPNGATESFLITPGKESLDLVATLNNYTQNNQDVPFEFIIGYMKKNEIEKNYTLNPNEIIKKLNLVVKKDQYSTTLGILHITGEGNRFVFEGGDLGSSNIQLPGDLNKIYLDALSFNNRSKMNLKDLITLCGGVICKKPVTEKLVEAGIDDDGNTLYKKVEERVDYDFSLEKLDKTSLIKLLM